MAYIPDEAVERMREIGGNAFKLYVYLCRRADPEGRCWPGLKRIADECGWQINHAAEYRKTLKTAGWITVTGDQIQCCIGFNQSQNGTMDSPKTGLNQSNFGTTLVPKLDSPYRNNQPNEPSQENQPRGRPPQASPSGGAARAGPQAVGTPDEKTVTESSPGGEICTQHPAVQAVRAVMSRYPNRVNFAAIADALGEQPDEAKLRECFAEWCKRGFNPLNLAWLFQWYACGIPPDTRASPPAWNGAHANGNPAPPRFTTRNTVHNEAAMLEAIRRTRERAKRNAD